MIADHENSVHVPLKIIVQSVSILIDFIAWCGKVYCSAKEKKMETMNYRNGKHVVKTTRTVNSRTNNLRRTRMIDSLNSRKLDTGRDERIAEYARRADLELPLFEG